MNDKLLNDDDIHGYLLKYVESFKNDFNELNTDHFIIFLIVFLYNILKNIKGINHNNIEHYINRIYIGLKATYIQDQSYRENK